MLRVDLGNLTDEAGAALLHHAGANRAGAAEIKPEDKELIAASREVDGHALTLSLLGRFLAYRRDGGSEMARLVYDALVQRRFACFMDVEDLKSGDFNKALFNKIDFATDVVVILSPSSLDRCHNTNDWVRLEISHAIQKDKNIVPVMMRGFQWPESPLPADMEKLLTFNAVEPSVVLFQASMDKLASMLHARPKVKMKRFLWIPMLVLLLGGGGVWAYMEQSKRALPPPAKVTARDVDELAGRIVMLSGVSMRNPAAIADRRLELQQMAVKVTTESRYREEAPGAVAALYRLTAASMLLQRNGSPDRERLKEGIYWLEKLINVNESTRADKQLAATKEFFEAYVDGRVTRWDAEEAIAYAVTLASLGSKDIDVRSITKQIMNGPGFIQVDDLKESP